MAGNVWSWTKDINTVNVGGGNYISTFTDPAFKIRYGPGGDYSFVSASPYAGLGYIFGAAQTGLTRGGRWYNNDQSGVFATAVDTAETAIQNYFGFRCVYQRPDRY